MSILIKGIDMPKEHGYIDITIFGDGEAYYEYNTIDTGENQTTAIQIGRPHGRLIDGDMVADMLDSMMAHGTLNRAYDEVMDAPTILEAEE